MQDLKPIRVFLEVAAQSSFAGAARTLRMTPASVTRIVARLEEDLGQQLLLRTTRQVSLTSAGAVVAARYTPILREFDRATQDITRANRPDRGKLKISAPLSFGMRVLPELVDSFCLAYPSISLDVQMTDRLIDIVEEGPDLSIRISRPPTDKSTIWRKICQIPRYAVAAPDLFNRVPRPKSPEDLNAEHCLSYATSGEAEEWNFSQNGARRSVRAGTHILSNNGDFLGNLVRSGLGIAVLPEFIVASDLAQGRVERVLPDWQVDPLWLTLFYPPYEQLPPMVATFTDFFEAYLRQSDGMDFGAG
ncbi:MAG: LysR family transcriptional regulator [Pseudomonadota bacterium]